MTAKPPVKRRVGRPRNAPEQSFAALLQTRPQVFKTYRFFEAYLIAHPRSTEEAAIAAAEDEFGCSRSTVQRRIKQLEQWMPIIDKGIKTLLGLVKPSTPTRGYDSTLYEGLTRRLGAFYSADDVAEISTRLGAPTALRIAEKCEELQALPGIRKRTRKKTAR
jgi:hypothetical protein